MDYKRDEHWVRLVGDVAIKCRRLILSKCEDQGWEVLQLAVQPDHVHLFVRTFPTNSAAEVVKEVKGLTSRVLRQQFPSLKKLPSMWTRSYFASTAENVSEETIQRYIEAQRGI